METTPATAGPAAAKAAAPGGVAATRKPRRRRWLLGAAAAILAVGVAGWWLLGRPRAVSYSVSLLSVGEISRSVTASGTVNPELTVLVGAYDSGTIDSISCDFNTRVHRGQICARIDPKPYQVVADEDAAALATARAQLVKDQAALIYAKAADQRSSTLWSENSISRDAAELARSADDQAAAQVALDAATVNERAADLTAAKINLGYTNITSPVDGTVVSRNVTQGQTVASSFQTPTLFLIATDLTRMQVDANVSEGDVGSLAVGDTATFTVDAYPRRTFPAVITQIRQSPQSVQNVVTYDVVLTVANLDGALMPGMTATTKIITAERNGVLRAPSQALRYRPGGLAAKARPAGAEIYVLRDGKPVAVAVRAGLSDDTYTEISAPGLKAGDQVITAETAGSAGAPGGARAPTPTLRF